jgi:hypothetical protein
MTPEDGAKPTRLTDIPRIRDHINRIVDGWPPLSEETRAGIAAAFKGHTQPIRDAVAVRSAALTEQAGGSKDAA